MATENQRSTGYRRRRCWWKATRRMAPVASPAENSRPGSGSSTSQLSGRSPSNGNPLTTTAAPMVVHSTATAATPAYR